MAEARKSFWVSHRRWVWPCNCGGPRLRWEIGSLHPNSPEYGWQVAYECARCSAVVMLEDVWPPVELLRSETTP